MKNTEKRLKTDALFDKSLYTIKTLEDEIRADQHCKALLKVFHRELLKNKTITPLTAGSMANGADYYLRDFMIDNRRTNIFEISPELIQSFAGNWYIISTLEPNIGELRSILTGTSHFYSYCAEKKLVLQALAEKVTEACTRHEYYQQRIESFNELSGDGYIAWNSACS